MGTSGGRKAQSIPSDGKQLGLLLGSQPTGLQTRAQSSRRPRHATNRGPERAERLLGDEEEEAGVRGRQQTCQGWSKATSRCSNGLARAEPEARARDGRHRDWRSRH